jgi:hypothetical protein
MLKASDSNRKLNALAMGTRTSFDRDLASEINNLSPSLNTSCTSSPCASKLTILGGSEETKDTHRGLESMEETY